MQFLAFLKDSFRESRSGWVLQTMLVLSAILVLLVASISFTPTTVKTEVENSFGIFNWAMRNNPNLKGTQFVIEKYKESNQAEPWNSNYEFELVITTPTEETMKKLDEAREMPASRARSERFFKQVLKYLDNVKSTKLKEEPTERRYLITSEGTRAKDITAWRHIPRVLFAFDVAFLSSSLREGVFLIENYLVGGAGAWIILFMSVVISAGFIPNMLQKGAVDLAVSKPISRWRLLVYKYLGGLTFIVLLTTFTIGGAYLAIGLRTGLFNHNFLLVIPVLTFYFAALYAVSTFVAVLTRSQIVAILATLFAWVLLWGVGKLNSGVENREASIAKQLENQQLGKDDVILEPGEKPDLDGIMAKINPDAPLWGIFPNWSFAPIKVIHTISPRTYQLDGRLDRLIAEGILTEAELEDEGYNKPPPAGWPEMIGVTLGFIAIMLTLSSLIFGRRDG